MAGHSHAKNVMHRKNAQNSKKAKYFTRIARAISIALSSGGSDIDTNPRLRDALRLAKSYNIPKDNIERILKKNDEKENWEEVVYEGYAQGGVAVLIEAITDNRNRTASEIRGIFNKFGGSMGEMNSVSFMFDKKGIIELAISDESKILELGVSVDAIDIDENVIIVEPAKFHSALDLIEKCCSVQNSFIGLFPNHYVSLPNRETFDKMIEAFDDFDDVQSTWHNLTE
jgi:YebC/PmpR family DNA-binding regulatory protein